MLLTKRETKLLETFNKFVGKETFNKVSDGSCCIFNKITGVDLDGDLLLICNDDIATYNKLSSDFVSHYMYNHRNDLVITYCDKSLYLSNLDSEEHEIIISNKNQAKKLLKEIQVLLSQNLEESDYTIIDFDCTIFNYLCSYNGLNQFYDIGCKELKEDELIEFCALLEEYIHV